MQTSGAHIFTWGNLSTILDVLIIWFVVYHLVILIRGTKAVQLAKGEELGHSLLSSKKLAWKIILKLGLSLTPMLQENY